MRFCDRTWGSVSHFLHSEDAQPSLGYNLEVREGPKLGEVCNGLNRGGQLALVQGMSELAVSESGPNPEPWKQDEVRP